jgi:hypothetical protein
MSVDARFAICNMCTVSELFSFWRDPRLRMGRVDHTVGIWCAIGHFCP